MKTKHLLLGMGILLAAGGSWFGRAAWRAHHQLVTLNVRNVPLGQVLRKIERQTRTKIRAESSLDARITLHVSLEPLTNVLDRLAEQAGARWSTLYAVYDSIHALSALDSALRGDGKLEPAGWTRIAPDLPSPSQLETQEPHSFPLPNANPDPSGPMPGQPRMMMMAKRMKNGANGPIFFGGPGGQTEVWSPEELLIESPLTARLGAGHDQAPTAAAAAETARKVHGRWTTYMAFRKSSMGIGMMPPGRPGSGPALHGPNDRFSRLTPEQRVLRARELRGLHDK